MKRKKLICIAGLMTIILISIILIIHFKNDKDAITDYINSFSLVYRCSNYAYDGRDELYIIEEDGTVRYLDMNNRKQKNDTLISTVLSALSDSDYVIGDADPISNEIVSEIYSTNFNNLDYEAQQGAFDAPESVFYILIETETSIKLVGLSEYGGNNIISNYELRENIEDYINAKIKSLQH